ncbi:hypothetical protein EVAR_94254_1 [Eumeta japonica]|uniref:Uncharacterized protein n=1 Tax=Eumeta variegata TaxID=151549 RepID=A0A4C1UNS7_EUMVA|nr:hypothetical protein EVAR_94254_1 [Eumeta japonica]
MRVTPSRSAPVRVHLTQLPSADRFRRNSSDRRRGLTLLPLAVPTCTRSSLASPPKSSSQHDAGAVSTDVT